MPAPARPMLLARLRWWARRRRLVPLLGLVVLAAGTGVTVTSTLERAEDAVLAWGDRLPTVVAGRDLDAGTVVDAADLVVRDLPRVARPDGSPAAVDAVVGRTLTADVVAGEPVVARRLAPAGLSGAAARVPPGRRAVTVPAARGAAPPVQPGDHVDLVSVADGAAAARGAVVVDVGADGGLTVAVAAEEVGPVARALGGGEVLPVLAGAR